MDLYNIFLTEQVGDGSPLSAAGLFFLEEAQPIRLAIDEITIGKCYADEIYISQIPMENPESWDGSIPAEWGYDTVLHANFNGDLSAGSIEYSAEVVAELRLKRRLKNTVKWKTIYSRPVNGVEDFQFDYYDDVTASNSTYEYLLVPVIRVEKDGEIREEEGRISAQAVHDIDVKFRDYFLFDSDNMFHVILNSSNSFTYNQEGASYTTIARKYPYVVSNGAVGYYSGTFQATFIEPVNCDWDVMNGAFYRKKIDQFLTNGKVKILKDWMGNMNMISVFEPISQDSGSHPSAPTHQVNWVEIGDVDSIADLYENHFINTDLDRE